MTTTKSKIGEVAALAALGVIALLAAKNWGTLQVIGSGVNSKVSSGLTTIAAAVSDAAKE